MDSLCFVPYFLTYVVIVIVVPTLYVLRAEQNN